jgi:hypothetical protein
MSDEGHGGLDGIEEAFEAAEVERDGMEEHMQELYRAAKAATVGSTVECPVCFKPFVKTTKGQAFCSHRGRGNCKDRFWNLTNEERRERAAIMNR